MKIGIIGFGHLAKSFAKGLVESGFLKEKDLYVTCKSEESKAKASSDFSVNVMENNKSLVDEVDLVILSVKPNQGTDVLTEIKDSIKNKILISFLAGTSFEQVYSVLDKDTKLIRIIPNIAMATRSSLNAISPSDFIDDKDLEIVKKIFSELGENIICSEEDLEKISVISSSGLGYVFHLLAGFNQAGLDLGLKDELSLISSQTFLGAVKTLQASKENPSILASQVATKGGTTIEGLNVLEKEKVNEAISKAAKASYEKVLEFRKRR